MSKYAIIDTERNSWLYEDSTWKEASDHFREMVQADVPCVMVEIHKEYQRDSSSDAPRWDEAERAGR